MINNNNKSQKEIFAVKHTYGASDVLKMLIVCLPPLLCFVYIFMYCFRTPTGDEWAMIELAREIDAGNLSFDMFWRQHNEHRILFLALSQKHGRGKSENGL